MNRPRLAPFLLCIVLSISISTTAHAELIDFNSFGNGEKISGFDLSSSVSVSSTGANLGPAIFDSDPAGPNGGGR